MEAVLDLRSASKCAIKNDPSPGMGLFEEAGQLFIGPWVWARDEGVWGWQPPIAMGAGYESLGGDPLARMRLSHRNTLADMLQLLRRDLPDSNLADILTHFVLGSLAHPRGTLRPKPIRFGNSGLDLYLGSFGRVLHEPLSTGHPNLDATLRVRRSDYRRARAAGVSLAALRRWTGHDARRLFRRDPTPNDLTKLLPIEHIHDGWERPATSITESFNTGDSSTLGPDLSWVEYSEIDGTTGDKWEVLSNECNVTGAGGGEDFGARANSSLSSDDHDAQVTVTALGTGSENAQYGTAVRFKTDGTELYYLRFKQSSDNLQIKKGVSGTFTSLGQNGNTPSPPDDVKLEANGSTIKSYLNGTEIRSATDTAITGHLQTGIVGFRGSGAGYAATGDAFTAGDLAAAAAKRRRVGVGAGWSMRR